MPQLEVPNRYLALGPVIVTAPTPRCGTTIVQRLVSASGNAFLYGEEVGHHIRTLTNFLVGLIQQFDQNGAASDEDYARALAGELTDWRPGLMAPVAVMLKGWVETYYQLPMALAEHGAAIGRPIWGFKGPDYTRDQLKAFLMLMPRAKIIYVFRHLKGALRSAKARRFATTDAEVAAFCARWATNMREVVALRSDPRLLFVPYESLAEDAAAIIRVLEGFTGAQGIDRAVLAVKVNTYAGEASEGRSPTQYIEPAALTDADNAAIEAHAGAILAQLYGGG